VSAVEGLAVLTLVLKILHLVRALYSS
jgi:hypothetical protein